jgi:DNA-binding transcriptional regulator LsrR (DeoR family)
LRPGQFQNGALRGRLLDILVTNELAALALLELGHLSR